MKNIRITEIDASTADDGFIGFGLNDGIDSWERKKGEENVSSAPSPGINKMRNYYWSLLTAS